MVYFITTDKTKRSRGVGIMKDKESKLEEIEVSHTLGGAVIHTQIRQSHGLKQTIPVWVVIPDSPVYMRERGGGTRVECGLRITIS